MRRERVSASRILYHAQSGHIVLQDTDRQPFMNSARMAPIVQDEFKRDMVRRAPSLIKGTRDNNLIVSQDPSTTDVSQLE